MAIDHHATWHDARIVETREIADRIRRVVLAPDNPRPVRAGEHVDLLIDIDGIPTNRSYSIVDATPSGDRIAISVLHTRNSRGGSEAIHALREGDRLRVSTPLQDFPLRIGAARYVLLAGGIGITAMIGMAAALQRVKADYELVFVGRSRSAMAYLDHLRETHGERLRVHIDDEGDTLDTTALVDSITPGAELYMCGPIRLMDAVRRAWINADHDITALRYETFGSSGWFEPEPFDIAIPRLGVECTVRPDESALDALERAGVDMMFDCRKGECGVCQVDVLGVEGVVDHRDVFFSDEQKATTSRMACCVSRVARPGAPAADESRPVALPAPTGPRPRLILDVT